MHASIFPCMQSTTLLTLSTLCQPLGWIYNFYGRSFIHECMLHSLLYLFLLQLILSSMQLFFFLELFLQHMQLLLCSILYLCAIFMLHHHLIAWVSKVSFITSGSAWACNFFLPLCCQQPSSCVHCIWYAAFIYCWLCFLLWCCYVISWYPCLWTTWCLRG